MEWGVKKLGELLKVQNGYAFNSKLFTNETGTPLIRIRDIKKGIGTITNFNGSYDKKYEVKSGDFLIGMDGEFGCYEWKGDTALLNQRVCRLQDFSNRINSRFLFYGINKYLKAIEEVTAFATVKHISSKQIEAIEIPLPPLPEQLRIVAILDEAFESITKAKENAEKNLKNANEIFESYLQSVFDNKGEGWEEKTLGEVCEIIMGQSPAGESYNIIGDGVPLINGPVEFGEESFSKTIKSKFTTKPTKFCKENDLILCVRGSTTGRINIAGFDACIGRGVAAIRYSKNQYWLNYFILSSRQKICDLGTGSTFPNVSTNILKNIIIHLPPLKDQKSIVTKLDAISSETKKLETIYTQKLADLEELKKSILAKAFNGELTEASA